MKRINGEVIIIIDELIDRIKEFGEFILEKISLILSLVGGISLLYVILTICFSVTKLLVKPSYSTAMFTSLNQPIEYLINAKAAIICVIISPLCLWSAMQIRRKLQ